MSYESSVESLYSLGHELSQSGRKFDLAHMRRLLVELDNPESKFPAVLIAGTNGKGSTAAALASILICSGTGTGLYTSPHLVRVNERIQVQGRAISDDEFASIHEAVEAAAMRLVESGELPWHPSFFEMVTAMAFAYFARRKVEIAVLEVGMGGRLDATNVVEPRVSVITDIALDHQEFLGSTVAAIAGEKAGIIHQNGVLVTLPQMREANDVIGQRAMDMNAKAVSAVRYVPPVTPGSAPLVEEGVMRYPLEVMGEQIEIVSPLVGRHQLRNLGLAIASAVELGGQGFSVTPRSIAEGVRTIKWPGRLQVLPRSESRPDVLFDAAHNPAGAWALRSALSERYEGRKLVLVFGAMRDKAIREMAEILFPLADQVVAATANSPRAASVEEIAEAGRRTATPIEQAENVEAGWSKAKDLAGQNGLVVIAGSVHLVGEAMRIPELRR